MIANIKATPLQKNKLQVKLSVFSCSFLCSWLVLYSPCVLPDITVDGGSNTGITILNTNVPVVDIAKPSAGGVSHNTFGAFNVDLQGVVINNSLIDGTSALAGAVPANTNFKNQSATIILNEVTGTSRSNLLGTTEIFGDNASYILANPNGITCNGCGFIRTPTALGDSGGLREVILSTSDALELSGNDDLDFLSIGTNSTADILIGPGGLDIGNVDVTTLFTRKLNIDGLISAANNRLQMLLGTGALDFDAVLPEDRTFTATQSDDGLVTVAIDASVAGAMNASQIYIIATEDGVGVTLDSTLIASAGNIELTANGDIVYRNVNASDSFNVTTNLADTTLTTTGTTVAGNDINWNLAGDALVDSGAATTITAGGNFTVDCTNGDCDLTSQDSLNINAAQLNTNANIISTANKALSINANLNSTANIQSGDTLRITSSGASSTGNITATGAITVNSATLNAGEIQTGDTVSINTVGSTTTTNIIAQSTVDIDAATITTANINSGGRLELSATTGNITTGTLTAADTVAINTQASGANLITNGINSGGDVSWQLNGQAQLAGNVTAVNNINFNCTTPDCTVNSDNTLQLNAQNLNTQANIQTANNRDLTINANLQSNADISSGNRLHISASNGDIISSGALSANQAIELTSAAGGNIDIAGLITSGADFIINGDGNYTHNNTENLNIAGDWIIDTHSLTNNDTIITSDLQNNVFRVDEFHNNGLFQSDGPLTLQVDDLLNNNGIITSLEGVIKINHSQAEGNTGTINNNGIINAISLSQQQQPENTLIINPQSIIDNYVADILAGKQRTSQDLLNDINTANQETLSQLTAGTGELGSLQINAGILNNNEAAQISATQVALNVDVLNNHGGLITAAKNIAINGNTLSNSNTTDIFGVITARDNIDITLNNQFDNEGIIEANDIVIDAPIQNNNSGMVLSGLTGQDLSTSSNLASTSSQLWFTTTQGSDNYYQYSKALDNGPLIDSNLTQLTDAFLAASATNLNGLPVAGDDLFLAELISNTIRDNGDIPFITDDRNSLAQLSTLYSNTLAFMDAADLNPGQLPTATQRQQMAAPILVFQQQSLPNGDVILAPTILRPNAELNTSTLAADQINSSILAHNNLLLKGEQITNSGDLIAGNNLIIDTVDLALTTSERNWFINENGEVQYHSAVISAPSLAVSISGNYVQKGGQLITENPIIIEAKNIDISGIDVHTPSIQPGTIQTAQAIIESPDALYLLAQQRLNIGNNALLTSKKDTLLSAGQALAIDGTMQSGQDLTLTANQIRVGGPTGNKNQVAGTSLLAQGNILLQSQTHIDLGYADITAGHTQNTHEPENTETQTGDITAGIMLLAQDGYINSQYTTLNAGADIYMSASDDINSRNTLLSSNNTFQQATNINLLNTTINNTESTNLIASNNLLTKNSSINSGDLNLFADNGSVTVNQSQLTANGDMTLSANNDVLLRSSNLQANTNATKDSLINEKLAVEQQPYKSGNLIILADKGDIINTAGSLSAQNSGYMKAGGNIINRSTQTVVDKKTKYNRKIRTQKTHVRASHDDEYAPAHNIVETTVTDTKIEGQYVDSHVASINTGDGGLIQIAGGDIVNEGGKVKSSGNIFQQAEGSIKNTTLTKRFTKNKTTRVTTSKKTTDNYNRQNDNTTTRRGVLSYKTEGIAALTATTGAGGNLTQIAGKDIINNAGKLIAGKDIYQQAEGNIKNLSKDVTAYNNVSIGFALPTGKRELLAGFKRTTPRMTGLKRTNSRMARFNRTTPGKKQLYTASTSAGGNLIVKAEKGTYTNTGNISAGKDIDISAKDIINTRLTRKLGNLRNIQAKDAYTATTTTTTGRRQVLDTGRVTAGGNIILNASNKVTDTAGRYRAGTKGPLTDAEGNVRHDDNGNTLKGGIYADAKNGITFNDIKWTERDRITETKSYLRYDSDGDTNGLYKVSNDIGYNTRDKVVTGNLRSAGHTSLKSEKGDLNLAGTDITAGQQIALEGRNIKLEAISKKQDQYRHQGRTTTHNYTIRNDVVNLNAKDGITFTTTGNKKAGHGNLTTQGAKLNAGKDATDNVIMNITGNTNLDGVNDEVYSYYYHKKKKSFGRSKTTIIENHDVTLNETEINGGGNLLVNIAFDKIGQPVGRDSGTVTLEGTKVNMGQNALIYGEDGVNILSGIEYSYARKETHKSGFGGFSKSGSTNIVEQQRLGHAEITTGGDTVLLSKNNINVVAGKLTANDITADAGFGLSDEEREAVKSEGKANVNIIGDKEALASFDHKYKKGLSFSVQDNFLSLAEETHEKDWAESETYIGSVLNARENITLRAASDVNVIGSQLIANDNLNINAGRDLNILSGVSTVHEKHEKETTRIGVSINPTEKGFEVFAGAETVKSGNEQNQTLGQGSFAGADTSAQLSGSTLLANNINLTSGEHTTILGSDLATWAQASNTLESGLNSGNISIDAGGNLITQASVSNDALSQYEERLRVGIKLTAQENVSGAKDAVDTARDEGGVANTLRAIDAIMGAKDSAIGGSAGIVAEVERSESNSNTSTSRATTLSASNNLTLKSGGDQIHTGTIASAGNNLSIQSGGDLIIQSAQNTQSGVSHSESASVKYGFGEGSPVSGSAAYSDSDNTSTTQQNAQFTAGNLLSLDVEGDTTLQGAVVKGTHLQTDLKGDLTLTSLQDTSHLEADNASISISQSDGGNGSYGVSAGQTMGDKAWVTEQTALIGVESASVKVKGHTQLNGGIINSEADNLQFETNTLAYSDIKDHDNYENTQANIGISTSQSAAASGQTGDMDENNSSQQKVNSFGYQNQETNKEQITRATLGAGNIIVHNDAITGNDSTQGINRDITKAQEITRDSSSDTDLYYSDSSFGVLASTVGVDGYDDSTLFDVLNPETFIADVTRSTIIGIDQLDNALFDAVTLNGVVGETNTGDRGLLNDTNVKQIAKDVSANIKGVTSAVKVYTNKEGKLRFVGQDKTFEERVNAIKGGKDLTETLADQADTINNLLTQDADSATQALEAAANTVAQNTDSNNVDVRLYTDAADHLAANADGYSTNNSNGENDKLGINTSNTDLGKGSAVIEVLSHELNHLNGGDEATAYLAESEAGYQWRNDNRLLNRQSSGGDMDEWNQNNQQVLNQNNQALQTQNPALMEFRQLKYQEALIMDKARVQIGALDISNDAKQFLSGTLEASACAKVRCAAHVPPEDPEYQSLKQLQDYGDTLSEDYLPDLMASLNVEPTYKEIVEGNSNFSFDREVTKQGFEYNTGQATADAIQASTGDEIQAVQETIKGGYEFTVYAGAEAINQVLQTKDSAGFAEYMANQVNATWSNAGTSNIGTASVNSLSAESWQPGQSIIVELAMIGIEVVPALKPIQSASKLVDALGDVVKARKQVDMDDLSLPKTDKALTLEQKNQLNINSSANWDGSVPVEEINDLRIRKLETEGDAFERMGASTKTPHKQGPELPEFHKKNFEETTYTNRQVDGDEVFYKYHGDDNRAGKTHNYVTDKKYETEAELREGAAILEEWPVSIDKITTFKPQKNTWISEGKAAGQVGELTGEVRKGGDYQGVIDIKNLPNSTVIKTEKLPESFKNGKTGNSNSNN